MLILKLLARMSGCVHNPDIIAFGRKNLRHLHKMGFCMSGIPSEPTLCRLGKQIPPDDFAAKAEAFIRKMMLKITPKGLKIIAIDGKCANGTTQDNGRSPDILSAHSVSPGITLATTVCDEKSNEITAVGDLLRPEIIGGSLVTGDAMFCQKDIAEAIRGCNADFLLAVKANQKSLRYTLEDRLGRVPCVDEYTEGPELSHGRIETRTCRTYRGSQVSVDSEKWGSRQTIVAVDKHTIRKSDKSETDDRRYYISSLDLAAKTACEYTRQHWGIESMHWNLDRNMLQDNIKRKYVTSARNLDTLQRTVLNIFALWRCFRKKRSDKKIGTAELIRRCKYNFSFLKQILALK